MTTTNGDLFQQIFSFVQNFHDIKNYHFQWMSLVFKKIEPLFIAVCWLPRSMSLELTVTVHTWMRPWCPQLNLLWKQTRCTFAHVGKLMDNLEIGWLLKDYYANFHNFLNQRSITLLLSLQDTTECMLSKYLLSITS